MGHFKVPESRRSAARRMSASEALRISRDTKARIRMDRASVGLGASPLLLRGAPRSARESCVTSWSSVSARRGTTAALRGGRCAPAARPRRASSAEKGELRERALILLFQWFCGHGVCQRMKSIAALSRATTVNVGLARNSHKREMRRGIHGVRSCQTARVAHRAAKAAWARNALEARASGSTVVHRCLSEARSRTRMRVFSEVRRPTPRRAPPEAVKQRGPGRDGNESGPPVLCPGDPRAMRACSRWIRRARVISAARSRPCGSPRSSSCRAPP
jgi:hypothetical protein